MVISHFLLGNSEETPKATEAAQKQEWIWVWYFYRTGSANEDTTTSTEIYRKGELFSSKLNV